MKGDKNTLTEHVNKMLYKSNYVFEAAKYRSLQDDEEFMDVINKSSMNATNEADGSEEDVKKKDVSPEGTFPAPNDQAEPEAQVAPPVEDDITDEFDPDELSKGVDVEKEHTDDPAIAEKIAKDHLKENPNYYSELEQSGIDDHSDVGIEGPPEDAQTPDPAAPAQSKDEITKDVLDLQLSAMKNMAEKLDTLELGMQGIATKMDIMSKDVEEVREPSDVEKLRSRAMDSYPYNLKMDDLWKPDGFKNQTEIGNINTPEGMKKTEDGYIADYDMLNKKSDKELEDSFSDY